MTHREPALLAYSACRLCVHSAEQGLVLVCTKPTLLNFGAAEPVAILRAPGGDCGPGATHHLTAYGQQEAA